MKVHNIFVRSQQKTYVFNDITTPQALKLRLQSLQGIAPEQQLLTLNSRPLPPTLPSSCHITLSLSLLGGKGGFGAKLKNQGSKKVRSNNTSQSRDLSGRRIKNVNLEKEYIESYKKKLHEDKIVMEERKKFKQMENTLYEEHAFMRLDKNYTAQLDDGDKNMQDAVKVGLISRRKKEDEEEKHKEKSIEKQKSVHSEKKQGDVKDQQPEKESDKQIEGDKQVQKPQDKKQQDNPESKEEKEKLSPLEKQLQQQDKPRKIMRTQIAAAVFDKAQAEKKITQIFAQPIQIKAHVLTSAASKLKSLFKK